MKKKNSGQFRKGLTPWNKGKKGLQTCFWKGKKLPWKVWNIGIPCTIEVKKKISNSNRGKHFSPSTEFKKCQPSWNKGIHSENSGTFKVGHTHSKETLKKMSNSLRGRIPWNFRGITSLSERVRKSWQYEQWRKQVYKHDKYTCRLCGAKDRYLNVHHLKSFSEYPELRMSVDNGLTVCIDCHCSIHGRFIPIPMKKHRR